MFRTRTDSARSLLPALKVAVAAAVLAAVAGPIGARALVDPGWLLVVQGEVRQVAGDEMVLAAKPRALAFTDRPRRIVRFIDLADFVVTSWGEDGDFRRDPPNASLVHGMNDMVGVIEITDAVYDNGELSVALAILEGDLPKVGDHVTLTIDHSVTKYPIENDTVTTTDDGSYAEGGTTTASTDGSHAEGSGTTDTSGDSHVEGGTTLP